MELHLLAIIGGAIVSIIGYFLKTTMEDLKEVKTTSYKTKSRLDVIENDYINKIDQLNIRFDMLNDSIKELTAELKEMKKK